MMASWQLFTGLVLIVAGASADNGWRLRQEFKFNVEGRSLTGLTIKPQFAGIHYRGVLRIQSQSSNVLMMKLQNMTYMKIHTELPNGWWSKIPNSEKVFRDLPITDSTVIIKFDRGLVESVSLEKGVENWQRNFIQGLVSQLQMDLIGANAMHAPNKNIVHRIEKETPVYKVMEDSVVGRCEVLYEVSPYSKPVAMANNDAILRDDLCGSRQYLEITKTRNFSNCETSAEYHFGLPSSLQCQPGGNQCGDFWTRSSVTRILGCGDRKDFLMLNSVRSSRLMTNLHFHNASQATVSSYLNLTLESVKPISRPFSTPSNSLPEVNLVYKYSGDNSRQSFLSSRCKEIKDTQSATNKKSNKSGNPSTEMHEEVAHIRKPRSPGQEPQASKKKQKERGKSKGKGNGNEKTTTPAPASSDSEDDSGEFSEEKQIWRLSKPDSTHAPHMPFSPFSLAYRQENEGSCLIQQFKDLVNEIISEFENHKVIPEQMTMEKIYIAVQMCQTMSFNDLSKVVTGTVDSQVRESQNLLTERKIYRDILAICGTNPAFQLVKSWIEEKKIKGEAAVEIISALPSYLQTPDSEVVSKFYDLIRSAAVREDQQLKSTGILAFSNLLRIACISNRERHARYPSHVVATLCTPKDATRYIRWLSSQLRSEPDLRLVYINALGNTGSSSVLPPLQTIADNENYSPIQRATAVFAMKYQVFQNPSTTVPVLLAIFHNTGNPTAVRIAAVSMLFYAKPPLSIWQRVAVSTWYEPTSAVSAFIRSSLSSLSSIKDPVYKDILKGASIAFPLSKPVSLSLHRAYNLMMTSTVENLQKVILEQISWIPGPDTTNFYYRHTHRLGGFSRVNFDGEMWIMNPDAFFTMLQELVYPSDDVTRARPMIKDLPRSTRWIHDALKIEPRLLPRLEGALHFKLNQLTERIFAFDKKISVDLAKGGRKFIEQVKEGKQFHYQKIDQSSLILATTTEMGFPINMHVDVPMAIRAVGKVKLNNETKELDLETSLMYMSQLIADLSIFTEWDQSVHVSAAYGVSIVNLPSMSYQAGLDKPNYMVTMKLSLMNANENNILIHHSSKSFTTQQDAYNLTPWSIAKNTKLVRMKEAEQTEMAIFPHVRLLFSTESMKQTPYNYKEEAVFVQGFPMMWSSLETNSFEVHLRNLSAVSLDFGLGSAISENGQINITRIPGDPKNNTPNQRETTTTTTTTETPVSKEAAPIANNTVQDSQEKGEEISKNQGSKDFTNQPESSTTMSPSSTTKPSSTTWRSSTRTTTEYPNESDVQMHSSENFKEPKFRPELIDEHVYSAKFEEEPSIFNATNLYPFLFKGYNSGYEYIIQHILKGINYGRAYVIGMNVTVHSAEPRKYKAFASYAVGMAGRYIKTGFFLNDNKTNDQTTWTASMYTPPTPLVNLAKILQANMFSQVYFDYDHKFDENVYQLSLQGSIGRSQKKLAALLATPVAGQCLREADILSPWCHNMVEKATSLNQFNLTLTYNDVAKKTSGATLVHYMNFARYTMYPYLSEAGELSDDDDDDDDVGLSNTIRVNLEVNGDGNTVDALIRTPSMETEFSGVPVSSLVSTVLLPKAEASVVQRLFTQGYCGVSNNSVITFDGVQYGYTMGNCWHVLTKDCSGKSRIVVLAKNTGHQTELEVNMDNYIVVSLRPGQHVSVNNRELPLQEDSVAEMNDLDGTKLIRMSSSPDSAIKMILPAHGFEIIYSNSTVILKADMGTQGRLCGMCGDNNNEVVGEMKTPRGKLESNPFIFASSYALKEADCKEYPREA